MRKIILASHGDYAKGLLDSVRMVVGSLADDITAYGLYEGASAEDYARELEREIAAAPAAEYIIITDIFGASVCTAMMRLTRHRQVRLFTGMNLSMILELLTGYPGPLSESDIVSLVESSRQGIMHISSIDVSKEEEDF